MVSLSRLRDLARGLLEAGAKRQWSSSSNDWRGPSGWHSAAQDGSAAVLVTTALAALLVE